MAILEATVELEEKAQVGRNKLSIQRNQLYLQNRAKDAHRVLALENQCGAKNAQGLLSELLLQQKTLDHSENLPRGGNMSQYIPSEAQIWSLQGKDEHTQAGSKTENLQWIQLTLTFLTEMPGESPV